MISSFDFPLGWEREAEKAPKSGIVLPISSWEGTIKMQGSRKASHGAKSGLSVVSPNSSPYSSRRRDCRFVS